MINNTDSIRYDLVIGSRRLSNYIWSLVTLVGGISFFTVGISSYFGVALEPITKIDNIKFIPQGMVMTFYGSASILLSIFLILSIILNVGGGYNKYDKNASAVEVFRLGFLGTNRDIYLQYSFKEIKSIKLIISEGLNPKREIYICLKDKREIPVTRVGEPVLLSKIEEAAVDLANFINVPLEGL
jgi:hypothetical protein